MATSEERLKRLDHRSREADNALKQLSICVQVLKQVTDNPDTSQQTVFDLERENAELTKEVQILKQKLIDAEILNGRPHIGNPQVVATAPINLTRLTGGDEGKPNVPVDATGDERSKATPPVTGNDGAAKVKQRKEKPVAATTKGDKPMDVSRLDFRIGRILSVKQHPDADTLYVEEIELGEDRPRTVCSGLVNNIPLEEMQDRLVIILCNLKPVKMRGILSEAMVMCACAPEKTEVLDPPPDCVPGDRVTFEGYPGVPDSQLNPKKKIFEQIQPDLVTDENCVAVYKGVPFTVAGKGICRSQTLKNTIIK